MQQMIRVHIVPFSAVTRTTTAMLSSETPPPKEKCKPITKTPLNLETGIPPQSLNSGVIFTSLPVPRTGTMGIS
jgi:hypothetical protein